MSNPVDTSQYVEFTAKQVREICPGKKFPDCDGFAWNLVETFFLIGDSFFGFRNGEPLSPTIQITGIKVEL